MSKQQKRKLRNIFTFSLNLVQFIICIILLVTLFTNLGVNQSIKFSWNTVKTYALITLLILILLINIFINKKLTFAISAMLSLIVAMLLLNFSSSLLMHGIAFATIATINAISNFLFA